MTRINTFLLSATLVALLTLGGMSPSGPLIYRYYFLGDLGGERIYRALAHGCELTIPLRSSRLSANSRFRLLRCLPWITP
jgi:hypothetical protein